MTSQSKVYVQILKSGEKQIHLYWMTGGDVEDQFLKASSGDLLVGRISDETRRKISKELDVVFSSEKSEIFDFDNFWNKVRNLKSGRYSLTSTCSVLLTGLGIIEDLMRTFKLSRILDAQKNDKLSQFYEKLFLGSNIPAVTPIGKSYHPIWKTEEIKAFRESMRLAWREIKRQAPRIGLS